MVKSLLLIHLGELSIAVRCLVCLVWAIQGPYFVIRPWPYNRGNRVGVVVVCVDGGFKFRYFSSSASWFLFMSNIVTKIALELFAAIIT